jgi:hypothetical protein
VASSTSAICSSTSASGVLAGEHQLHQRAAVGERRDGENADCRRQVDGAQGEQCARVLLAKPENRVCGPSGPPLSMFRQAFIRLTEKAGMHSVVAMVPITGMTFTRAINIQ